jgi:hypothetical protein
LDSPFIFVSCGQYTAQEKHLGTRIAEMVKNETGFEAFFAENVQNLLGLDGSILTALRDCAAFIVVLHPRGTIERPDDSRLVRASVWIEQEIAIATYIQRVEQRPLPIIAFKHVAVGREGLRHVLHLNPIEFTDESEVLAALKERLSPLAKSLRPHDVHLELVSTVSPRQDGHAIRKIELKLVNDTNKRIMEYNGELLIPAALLKHWSAFYPHEVGRSDPRRFQFDEKNSNGTLNPHTETSMLGFDYCPNCAEPHLTNPLETWIEGKMWIDGQEYGVKRTIRELHLQDWEHQPAQPDAAEPITSALDDGIIKTPVIYIMRPPEKLFAYEVTREGVPGTWYRVEYTNRDGKTNSKDTLNKDEANLLWHKFYQEWKGRPGGFGGAFGTGLNGNLPW